MTESRSVADIVEDDDEIKAAFALAFIPGIMGRLACAANPKTQNSLGCPPVFTIKTDRNTELLIIRDMENQEDSQSGQLLLNMIINTIKRGEYETIKAPLTQSFCALIVYETKVKIIYATPTAKESN